MLSALKDAKIWIEVDSEMDREMDDHDKATHLFILDKINNAIQKATQP
jgi:hypothetical protein